MKNLYPKGLLLLTFCGSTILNAQNNQRLKAIADNYSEDATNNVLYLQLKDEQRVYESNAETFLNTMILPEGSKVKSHKSETDPLGYTHHRYQVTYNNVPVLHSQVITHSRDGKITSVNGDFSVINSLHEPANSITLSESKALVSALNKIKAKKYKWQNSAEEQHVRMVLNKPDFSFYPKGELVLVKKGDNFHYAYKFNIYAEEPLYRANVIVDAQSGAILEEENLICTADVPGTANTKYSGVQSFTIDNFSAGNYRLRETGRGLGIETYNLNTSTSYANTDLTYTNTVWPATGIEQLGTDAHFGCEKTYDYYFINHGRNSLDNAGFKLLSYINYGSNYNNAFWDGLRMTYGSGGGGGFIGLDICGHEVSHGLTENTSNLVYSYESGALNESYSDIFGNSIEYYAKPASATWILGESIGGIRNMANPNAFGDPDTYLGTNWYTGTGDNGGVHTNSGVSNYWYYLLVQGGTGTNDISNTYTVNALGWTAASRIAFRALTVYYTPSTNYSNARALSIQAAKDLYGTCSNEVVQVTNAWYAVGVGPAYSNSIAPNFVASGTSFCTVPATISFSNTTLSGITYQWNFGDGSAVSTSTYPVHSYTANGTYSVKLKATGCLSSVDSITKVAYITINTPANPTTTGASRCGTGTLNLSASGTSQLNWYTSPTATGTPIFTGSNYTTPSLASNTTYYVVNTATNTPVFGAHTSSAVGTGANYNTATMYEIFDVTQPCTLRTVVMYASTAGNRTVELRNSSNTVITSTVVNLAIGANTVNLNFALPVATNLRLGLNSASAVNLFRTSSGAVYPYNIGGLVNITNSSASTPGYYYFFYNWQVQKNACVSAAVPVTASVGTSPAVTVNSATICNGQSVNLTASGATSYSWNTGATTSGISVTPSVSTTYSVIGTTGSCSANQTANVTVNPTPTVSVNSATLCTGQTATLSATGAGSYTFNPGNITGSSIAVNPTVTTTYTVTGQTGNCSGTAMSNVIVNTCTGVEEIPANMPDKIGIYPNPAQDYIVVYNTLSSDMTINIYDVTGKLIRTKTADFYRVTIDISHFSNGLYMVEIMNGDKRIYKTKIVKE
jgi:Zn-dependent metalloprotease